MVRPRVYSDEEVIAALVKSRGLVYVAAKKLGCDPDTIYNRRKDSPAVAAAIAGQRGLVVDRAEQKLFAALDRGERWAVTLVLKTLGKGRGYVERGEVTGPDGGPIPHEHNVTLTAADIAAARGLVGLAGGDVPAHGGQKPVGAAGGPAPGERPAAPIPPADRRQ